MKKIKTKFLFILLMQFYLGLNVNAQTADTTWVVKESFETDLSEWTIINNDGDTKQWEQYILDSHSGTYSARVSYSSTGNDDWLISKQLSIPSEGTAKLSLWGKSYGSSFLESYNIKISTSGTALTDFTTTLEAIVNEPNAWTNHEYDVSSYAGQSIYIAIQCVSVNMFYLFIDDFYVFVTGGTTSTIAANFEAGVTSGAAPLEVTFTDLSTGYPTSWKWDFGDGTVETSFMGVKTHTYNDVGTYDVKLVVSNNDGKDSITKNDYITVTGAGNTETENNNTIATANAIEFDTEITGEISPTSADEDWFKFSTPNDGAISVTITPLNNIFLGFVLNNFDGTYALETGSTTTETKTVTYNRLAKGSYSIKVAGANQAKYSVKIKFVATSIPDGNDTEPNSALADAKPHVNGQTGHLGYFDGTTSDIKDYYSFVLTYTSDMIFVVKPDAGLNSDISLYNSNGDWLYNTDYAVSPTDGVNDTVKLNAAIAGTYYMAITSNNGAGSYTLESQSSIVTNTLEAKFESDIVTGIAPLLVQFTDYSVGSPTAWAWDFDNDGTTDATDQNPQYTYSSPGNYAVKLTVTKDGLSDSEEKLGYITVDAAPVGTIQDIDGNEYDTVRIGTQTWTVQNLKVTKFNNGDAITNIQDNTQWGEQYASPLWANYDNNTANDAIYGKLYNYAVVKDDREVCPVGWHVPSKAEYETLIDYLGGNTIAGSALKETGTTHWSSTWAFPNTDATNESGFTALPAGERNGAGEFSQLTYYADFWTSTSTGDLFSPYYYLSLYIGGGETSITSGSGSTGMSIRCLKNTQPEVELPVLSTSSVTSITQTSSVSGGVITSDGGATITARGVCWSTNQNPTTANSKTNDGDGIGSFTSNIKGLTANTKYYLRAYATNSLGTAYGTEINFITTKVEEPTFAGWKAITSPSTEGLSSVSFFDKDFGFICGYSGTIFNYNNGQWIDQTISSGAEILDIDVFDKTTAFAGGKAGKTYKYDGTNWSQVDNGITSLDEVSGISMISATFGFAVGTKLVNNDLAGNVMAYNSVNWANVAINKITWLNEVSAVDESNAWICGYEGTILKYNDGLFSKETSPTTKELYGIYMLNKTLGWAVGNDGTIVKYDGTSWLVEESGTSADLRDVFFIDANNGWAVGWEGVILKYNGKTWSKQTSNSTEFLAGVYFTDKLNGWVVGSNGTILHTIDGGGEGTVNVNSSTTESIAIYPNPVSDVIRIQSNVKVSTIDLFDLSGKLLQTVQNSNEMNTHNMINGIYLVKITTKNNVYINKVLVK